MAAVPPVEQRVIYLVERLPPSPPKDSTAMDKVKQVAGTALALLGLAILLGASIALTGVLIGTVIIPIETIHTFFMTGMLSAIGGFHLARGGTQKPSIEITGGPVSVTI